MPIVHSLRLYRAVPGGLVGPWQEGQGALRMSDVKGGARCETTGGVEASIVMMDVGISASPVRPVDRAPLFD